MTCAAFSSANLIFHVPHASRSIPPVIRESLDLSDAALEQELTAMTDAGADELFLPCRSPGDRAVVFPWSRLVVDVERFRDDRDEVMAGCGMGAVYVLTHDGKSLRRPGFDREGLIRTYYDPHHAALEEAVQESLEESGRAFLLDCHTFPSWPLPCDLDQEPDRPDVCLGTDPFHTPEWAASTLASAFQRAGLRVAENRPYAGTIVPIAYLGRDACVLSVMIEIRRGLIIDEKTGCPILGAGNLARTVKDAVGRLREEYRMRIPVTGRALRSEERRNHGKREHED